MIDRYNFKASTRAYRGRLIKWGVRKYNCRRRSESGSISVCSPGDSMSRSNSASPPLSPPPSQPSAETPHDFVGYSSSHGQSRDNQPRMSNLVGRTYNTTDMETSRAYTQGYVMKPIILERRLITLSYDRNTHDVHGWPSSPTPSASPPTTFAHVNTAVSGPLYGYQPLSPPESTFSSMTYESEHISCDRRQSYPLVQQRQYTATHGSSNYLPIRGYGQGQRSAGIGSFESMSDQVARHNSTG
ncbi:hypothetical protein RRF57_002025 [Xylaria bambusicola]|uniref:Clr5 domain-containing protein n=1 Tax=Xylaria bambusicola TaxID=326684 RepID=A0AAN7U5R9_9PEZI